MSIKLFLFSSLILASLGGYTLGCGISEDDLEESFLEIMFFGSDKAIIPANDAEMEEHCKVIRHGIEGFKKYVDQCLKGFPKEALTILLGSMKSHMEKRCDNPKDKAEFVQYVQCLLPRAEKMGPINVCNDKHTKMIELAIDMGEDGHIHGSCCAYYMFRHCVIDQIKTICGEGHAQFWDEIFDDVATEVVTFACAGYDSKEKCQKDFNPEHYNRLHAIDVATDPAVWAHPYRTPMRYMLDMIKKYYS